MTATLYTTNPEMEYVPSARCRTRKARSRPAGSATAVRFAGPLLRRRHRGAGRALNYVDFLNSDEGILLGNFGIEGTHYNWENGIPKLTEEWTTISKEQPETFNLEGFGIAGSFLGTDPRKGWGWDAAYAEPGYVNARKFAAMKFFDGLTFDDIAQKWEGRGQYDELMSTFNWGDEEKRAIVADTDEKALEILNTYRSRMMEAGMEEMIAEIQKAYDADPTLIY